MLLHLARKLYPDIKAVFSNTGNEHPDNIKFVNKLIAEGCNIDIIRPKLTPRQVWEKRGFPLISKETADKISVICRLPDSPKAKRNLDRTCKFRLADKWLPFIQKQYRISDRCCYEMKKAPMARYAAEHKVCLVVGTMAEESRQRTTAYVLRGGCNSFKGKKSVSAPLSIWTEQDVWEYIRRFDVPISEAYYKGWDRTGCVGCGFGAHFKDDTRFKLLYEYYPKLYNMVMNYTNNGVTFREAIREVLAVNKLKLPDETDEKTENGNP